MNCFLFLDMNDALRLIMVKEINDAIAKGLLYYSKRFTDTGKARWPELLLAAAQSAHNEHGLAYRLEDINAMKEFERRTTPLGAYSVVYVPHTAAQTLADAEFNRYYMRAVCTRAQAEGKRVTVYRACTRANARPESEALIGQSFDPSEVHAAISELPSGSSHELVRPNSGLSLRIEQ